MTRTWIQRLVAICLMATLPAMAAEKRAIEPAHDIPVTREADVVVVGGSSAGVAAAVAAARSGAKVFLAAPRTFLGDDLCATYRLWLQPGETPNSPLGQALFAPPAGVPLSVNTSLPFTYTASVKSADKHPDTEKPSLLADGKWNNAPDQSVQYDASVEIVVDLGRTMPLGKAHVFVYQRDNDFEVEAVQAATSDDGKTWSSVVGVKNDRIGRGTFESPAIPLSLDLQGGARYIRFSVKKSETSTRVLLGEIVIEPKTAVRKEVKPVAYPPTPMQVKRALDKALLDAGVEFLFCSYVTDVLVDENGDPAGVAMVSRGGRQVIRAKVVIDATDRAVAARLTKAKFRDWPGGKQTFERVVIGGEPSLKAQALGGVKMPTPVLDSQGKTYEAISYTVAIDMADGSFASYEMANQMVRDQTWHVDQLRAGEATFHIPPDPVHAQKQLKGIWPGADKVSLDAFRPADVARIYVLSGCADVSRDAARKMLRPLEMLRLGTRIGQDAARAAKMAPAVKRVTLLDPRPGAQAVEGTVRELLDDGRTAADAIDTVRSPERGLPILGEYDVVVIGGGTGGAPAGIAAARQGAKTLVVEVLHGLGGVGTLGLITTYYHGNRVGFTAEVDHAVGAGSWKAEDKMEWFRKEIRKAGGEIWFGAVGTGALVQDGRVCGVVVTSQGVRGVVLAGNVIDSTGSASVAAAAGAPCVHTDGSHIAVQGTGLPPRNLGKNYTNSDYTFIDDLDDLDVWRAFVTGREKFKKEYDLGELIDSRERRQIVGDFTLSPLDVFNNRTYPDSVVLSASNFDSHGFTIHPLFLLQPPDRAEIATYVPYRCLLPQGLDGILVTGLGVSAHRDVMPVIRMQPDIQNQGYAAGVAAAMTAAEGKGVRSVDMKALQQHLVEKGNLPPNVTTDQDSFPLSDEKIASAVANLVDDPSGLPVFLTNPDAALPMLRRAYSTSEELGAQLVYAQTLGVLGDATGVETLLGAVRASEWDKGWKFTGMGQFGRSMSPLDSMIVALGRTRDKRALAPLLEKAQELNAASPLSHHRAIAEAFEILGDPAAAETLAALLNKPGMSGHAFGDMDTAKANIQGSITDNSTRERSLAELMLARALYRCGDYEGLGEKILTQYANDLRGHYMRHARAVLAESEK